MKPFHHPLTAVHLSHFLDRNDECFEADSTYTYATGPYWSIRTTNYINAPTRPIKKAAPYLPLFTNHIPPPTDPDWHHLDSYARLINKYPAELWQKDIIRHRPQIQINTFYAIRPLLQLATRLPAARIHLRAENHLIITFTNGALIHRTFTIALRDKNPSLTFMPRPAIEKL